MTQTPTDQRLAFLDILRGAALVAMAIYHFGWDLAFFGYVSSESVNFGPWKTFARCIASSFLMLVGFSLVLAHSNGIKWQGFWIRWAKIAGAALLITVATYFFMPDSFIFFGILHQIAFASVFGLLFLRLPWLILLMLGGGWIVAAPYLQIGALNGLHMAWTGLQTEGVRSNDYVPVFPWFGAVLIGMASAKLFVGSSVHQSAAQKTYTGPAPRILTFLGRNSLATYLIHQPVLIALVYLYSLVLPASVDQAQLSMSFATKCQASCEAEQSVERCAFYCGCVETRLRDKALFTPVITGKLDFNAGEPADISQQCSIEMFSMGNE